VNKVISSQVACQVDLGDGRQFDLEFPGDSELWLTTGPGLETVNLWAKTVAPEFDLRIRIVRTQAGIEVIVDRGQQEASWWSPDDCPRLTVAVDPNQNSVSVSARVGHGVNGREALLGSSPLGGS
jgi:hypothetical protein